MTLNNTDIPNLPAISKVAYNDLFPISDSNASDIYGLPILKSTTALQISDYVYRAFGTATNIADCDLAVKTVLNATYDNGTLGVGATLTNAGAFAAFSADGFLGAVGRRILVTTFTGADAPKNGIYEVTVAGDAISVNWVLRRPTDYDESAEIKLGTFVSILFGATLFGKAFVMVNADTITVGTSSIVFTFLGASLLSFTNSFFVTGAGNCILNISADTYLTIPPGTNTAVMQGDNVTLGTIASNSITFGSGTGLKTSRTAGNNYFLSGYDTTNSVDRVFGTTTAGTTPTLAFVQPTNGLMSWDGGAIGLNTPAAAKFTTITSNSLTFNDGTGIKTGTIAGNAAFLSARNTSNGTDVVFGTLIAGSTPAFDLSSAVTIGTNAIASKKGVVSGATATSGLVGEQIQGSVAASSSVSLSNAVNTDIVSLAYTAGNWLIMANPSITYTGSTNTEFLAFIGTASGNNQTGLATPTACFIEHSAADTTGSVSGSIVAPFNTSSSGTLYLKIKASFTVGTCAGFGALTMIRQPQSV